MARWLKTFLLLSVVAILNIVGFMYLSGYSFMIWGTPVDSQRIKSKVISNEDKLRVQEHDNLAQIFRQPAGQETKKNSEAVVDANNSQNAVFSPNQSGQAVAQTNLNIGGDNNNQVERVENPIVVKIQQPDIKQQQQQGQQQQGQQQQGQQQQEISNVINPQMPDNPKSNQGLSQRDTESDIADKLEQMKKEVEALEKKLAQQNGIPVRQVPDVKQVVPNMQVGPGQQNVNPAVANQGQAIQHQNNNPENQQQGVNLAPQDQKQLIGPKPDPHLKNIAPEKLQGIISKANPPNTERVFPHDFQLTLNEPSACENPDGSERNVFLLVVVNSIHKNFEQRRAIRATWGSVKDVDGKGVLTLFTLAKNSDKKLHELVQQESDQYHDLLMEDFTDTYKNLTYKTIMGLKWASTYCPHANFVMKTDDDMYINYESMVKYLASPKTPTQNHVAGFVINGSPIRDPKSKWYMPRDLYPGNKYPPFCSGTGYVMSGDVALKVYAISEYTPFLYLEDVYVAICLEKLHIVPVKHKEFNNWRTAYSYCRFKRIMTTHMVTPTEMNRIWKDQHSKKGYRC